MQTYLYVVGAIYAFVALLVLVVLILRNRFKIRPAVPSAGKVTLFLILLLGFGAIGQAIWSTCVWGRLYYTSGSVFGYLPFLPVTRKELGFALADQTVALNQISLTGLNLIWLAVTLLVWGGSIYCYRRLRGSGKWPGIPSTSNAQNIEHKPF